MLCCSEGAQLCTVSFRVRRKSWESGPELADCKTLALSERFVESPCPTPFRATHGSSGCGDFRIEPAQRGHRSPGRARGPCFRSTPEGAKAQNSLK